MAFPDPPKYAELYTEEAVKNGTAPPPPPIPKVFRVFGEEYDDTKPLIDPLKPAHYPQVYEDWTTMEGLKAEMKKLNSSAMAKFLDLMQLLISNSACEERDRMFDDIKLLFVNLHHLINHCRVLQARVSLVAVQEHQNASFKALIKLLNESEKFARDKCEEIVQNPFKSDFVMKPIKATQEVAEDHWNDAKVAGRPNDSHKMVYQYNRMVFDQHFDLAKFHQQQKKKKERKRPRAELEPVVDIVEPLKLSQE